MDDTYKLQYEGMTLTYPGWNGYLCYEAPKPITRYEYTLFETDGASVVSGVLNSPLTAYDEIGLCLKSNIEGSQGTDYVWLDKITATTGYHDINHYYANNNEFNIIDVKFNYTLTSFNINTYNTNGWNLYANVSSNERFYSRYNANILPIVNKIIGVKYQ